MFTTTYTFPCANCDYIPDPITHEDPNIKSDKITLCVECLIDMRRAFLTYSNEHPTPRPLYGTGVTYRELHIT